MTPQAKGKSTIIKSVMKKSIILFTGIIIGVLLTLLWIKFAQPWLRYFAAPTVTVINATGDTMSNVRVSLGNASSIIRELKNGRQATVSIHGKFGESSTHVHWTDSQGTNNAIADDYMENIGFYRSTVVITPDKKAKAIYAVLPD